MEFFIDSWLDELVRKIRSEFADKLVFIGLQGSYQRKEAGPDSDVDIVVILDKLNLNDLKKYRSIIAQMPHKEKACGFISGKKEIMGWERSELFQFCYDTKPLYGNLDCLLSLVEKEDIRRAIKIGACNLYHACCHNFLYEKDFALLITFYKSVFFILQAKYFYETNKYIGSKFELASNLQGMDAEMLNICINRKQLKQLEERALNAYTEKIIIWSSSILESY